METWMLIWQVMLIVVLVFFIGMALWVTIGGFRELKQLFKKIEDQHCRSEEEG